MSEAFTRVACGYTIIIERAVDEHGRPSNYGAHVRDLPGVYAFGDTIDETVELMEGAIDMHLEGLQELGQPIPPPDAVEASERTRAATGS